MEHSSTHFPAGAGTRRQDERSEATRARVIAAAVACVAEEGFQNANLAAIARRAKVTTGAIQHQFGDKAGLLEAVVEEGFGRMTDTVARLACEGRDLVDRLQAFIAALWAGYDATHTRASIEILFAMRNEPTFNEAALGFLADVRGRIDRMWMGTFWDLEIDRTTHIDAQRMIFSVLNGLALERILIPADGAPQRDLDRLVGNIVNLIHEIQETTP